MMSKTNPRAPLKFKLLALAGLGIMRLATPLCAQTAVTAPAKVPAYDIVLIKQDKSASDNVMININEDTFKATNVTLLMIISNAYGIKEDLISGLPGWTNSYHFDFTAKMLDSDPDALKKLKGTERQAMLKPVLADRFKLQLHTETKTLPVYNLVVVKNGSKLKKSPDDPPPTPGKDPAPRRGGMMRIQQSSMTATRIEVKGLADMLARQLHRTVIDQTGLAGSYDFDLNWTPPEGSDNSPEATDAALFTALQEQLGLRLESSKGPVETLVVDHVEQPQED